MPVGFERTELTEDLNQQVTGKVAVPDVPRIGISAPRTPDISLYEKYSGFATLGKILGTASNIAGVQMEKKQNEDYLQGKMLAAEGKTADEMAKEGHGYSTRAGWNAMNAEIAVSRMYEEKLSEIENGEYEKDPNEFREGLMKMYRGVLTGTPAVDQYMTKLFEPQFGKLVQAHMRAHEGWKREKTAESATNLLVQQSRVAETDEEITAFQQLVGEVITGESSPHYDGIVSSLPESKRKEVLSKAVLLGLEEDNEKLLRTIQGTHGLQVFTPAQQATILNAHQQFQTRQRSKVNIAREVAIQENKIAVRTGQKSLLEGLQEIQNINSMYPMSEPELRSETGQVSTANMSWILQQQSELRTAASKRDKELEEYRLAEQSLMNGQLASQKDVIREKAFQIIDDRIADDLRRNQPLYRLPDGSVDVERMRLESLQRGAWARAETGVVDQKWRKNINANLRTPFNDKGELNDHALDAYEQLRAIADTDPGHAQEYMDDYTREFMYMAMAADDYNMTPTEAMQFAAQRMRSGVDAKELQEKWKSKAGQEQIGKIASSLAHKLSPRLFSGRGSWLNVDSDEFDEAANDPEVQFKLRRIATVARLQNPRLSDDELQVMLEHNLKSRSAFIGGSLIITDAPIKSRMRLEDFNEDGVEHEAFLWFMQDAGPKLFGTQWNDRNIATREGLVKGTYGYIGSRIRELVRGAPRMDVRYSEGSNAFSVSVQLNDGTWSLPAWVPADAVGEYYRIKRREEDLRPAIDRAEEEAMSASINEVRRAVVTNNPGLDLSDLPAD